MSLNNGHEFVDKVMVGTDKVMVVTDKVMVGTDSKKLSLTCQKVGTDKNQEKGSH